MLKGRGGYGWVSGLLRLAMGLVEIGGRGSLGLVEISALPLPSPPLHIAKGFPHPKSSSYIGNLGELPIFIIAPSKFPNGKSLGSLSQSLTPRCTVSLSCATTFLCRLIGFGGDWRGSDAVGFLVFCCDASFFFFTCVFVPVGFWWVVDSGGVVGMVEARWW